MPKLDPTSSVFALQMVGDFAGVTFIQNVQRRRIAYAKTYPKRTATAKQQQQRGRFHAAIVAWRALTPTQKQTLDDITNKKRMVMSGYNLYISCYLNNHLEWIAEFAAELALPW